MERYISKAYLSHKGKIVKPNEIVKLTDEQAARLGNKVEKEKDILVIEETKEKGKSYEEMTVSELKELAGALNLEGYSKLKKDELVKLLNEGV